MSLTAAAVKFARTKDLANEYRRSSTPAPIADIVEELHTWKAKEEIAFEELADCLALDGFPVKRAV